MRLWLQTLPWSYIGAVLDYATSRTVTWLCLGVLCVFHPIAVTVGKPAMDSTPAAGLISGKKSWRDFSFRHFSIAVRSQAISGITSPCFGEHVKTSVEFVCHGTREWGTKVAPVFVHTLIRYNILCPAQIAGLCWDWPPWANLARRTLLYRLLMGYYTLFAL